MGKIIDAFADKPLLFQIIAPACLAVGLVYGLYMVMLAGPATELVETTEKLEDVQGEITKQNGIARNLARYKDEVRDLDLKLRQVLQELPDAKQIPAFLNSVADLAVETGLEVTEFDQASEVSNAYFAEVPVKVQLQGSFHQLATFLDEVGHLDRIINMKDLDIKVVSSDREAGVELKANCLATTYRYLSGINSDSKSSKEKPDNA